MKISVGNVQVGDAESLLKIYEYYVSNTAITFEYQVPSVEEFQKRIESISSKYPYIKAFDEDGNILGYAYASAFKGRKAYDWAIETSIYVNKDLRREGVGRILYEALEKRLKEMGITNMNACIASPRGKDIHLNDDSIKFHEKLGFSLVGLFHECGYKFNKWYDMCWMEKMIGSHEENMQEVDWSKRKI